MKDPFEAACEEQGSPPESPIQAEEEEEEEVVEVPQKQEHEQHDDQTEGKVVVNAKGKEKEEEILEADEEEENSIRVESKVNSGQSELDKKIKMQEVLSKFTDDQMSRYESFRRSGFQKSNMRRLLASITGSQKISMPITIVVSGIAKMFVGELVEMGKTVMMERNESGPLRPCHIREAYRRLKLEGKIPKRSIPRLFR